MLKSIESYLLEITIHAYDMGYVERGGRNKGPRLSITYARRCRRECLNPEEAARELMKERDLKK